MKCSKTFREALTIFSLFASSGDRGAKSGLSDTRTMVGHGQERFKKNLDREGRELIVSVGLECVTPPLAAKNYFLHKLR